MQQEGRRNSRGKVTQLTLCFPLQVMPFHSGQLDLRPWDRQHAAGGPEKLPRKGNTTLTLCCPQVTPFDLGQLDLRPWDKHNTLEGEEKLPRKGKTAPFINISIIIVVILFPGQHGYVPNRWTALANYGSYATLSITTCTIMGGKVGHFITNNG